MPIKLPTSLTQEGRGSRVTTPNFFHLVETSDIDFTVEKTLLPDDCSVPPPTSRANGDKYLLLTVDSGCITPPEGAAVNDIIMWDTASQNWTIYLSLSNPKTQFGLVFDKHRKKFFQYVDASTGWKPVLRSGSVDGGTF